MFKNWKIIFFAVFSCIQISSAAEVNSGKDIYDQACKTCHNANTAVILRAPAVHDIRSWQLRFQAAQAGLNAKGANFKDVMAYFLNSIRNGKGAMIQEGLCTNPNTPDHKCTDADLIAAIKYMSSPDLVEGHKRK